MHLGFFLLGGGGRAIEAHPKNVDTLIKATIALHNFLLAGDGAKQPTARYLPPQFADSVDEEGELCPGQWRRITEGDGNFQNVGRLGANVSSFRASARREQFSDYFLTEQGMVPWQDNVVHRGEHPS